MLRILAVLAAMAATPVVAQQALDCRGKHSFQLSGGVKGCIYEIGDGNITHSRRIEGGAKISSRNKPSAVVNVLLYGPFEDRGNVVKSRIVSICKSFSGDIQKAMGAQGYSNVIVRMIWPEVPAVGNTRVAVQVGFTSDKCRGARFFDR